MKEKKFHIFYLFSLRITCVKNGFIQTCRKHSSLFLTGNWTRNAIVYFNVYFNGFSLAVYCIFLICHKKLWHFDSYFQPCMSDFATAAFLINIEGAYKCVSLLDISYECRNAVFGSQGLYIRSGLGTKLQAPVLFVIIFLGLWMAKCLRSWVYSYVSLTWPRGYKKEFMLNSAEHEIFPAH